MSPDDLVHRSEVLRAIREFFYTRGLIEVEVPCLGHSTVTDPHIAAFPLEYQRSEAYLQTSPEYFMKRLLTSGSGAMFYLGKAFRNDEAGPRHNPEFTMLEWYRPDFDDRMLREEIILLLESLGVSEPVRSCEYGELFFTHLGLDPHCADTAELAALVKKTLDLHGESFDLSDRNLCLDLLFSYALEPRLEAPTLVYDYPASQCALARLGRNGEGQQVAKRFELFWRGLEIANGYWELGSAEDLRERFNRDLHVRRQAKLPEVRVDEKFIDAMKIGLPDCSGVALGVDRLLMALWKRDNLCEVMSFTFNDT